jgi:hypothetical protein
VVYRAQLSHSRRPFSFEKCKQSNEPIACLAQASAQRLLLVAVANHDVETGKVGKASANKCGRKPEKEKKRKRKWERKSKDKAGGLHLSPPFFVVIAFSRNNPSPFPLLVLPFSFPHNNFHNLLRHPSPFPFLSFFQSIN